MDGWMNGWMNELMDELMDVCLMNGWMDTWTDYIHLQTLFTNGLKDDSILQTLVMDGYKMIEKFHIL